MSRDAVISFPHIGSYAAVFEQLLRRVFPDATILPPPPITQKTVLLGSKHSPDFVCAPFKYNLGNYIEALEQGATVLFQTGMGCRCGYYGELQEQILKDLGYDFQFLCLSRDRLRPRTALRLLREAGCTLSAPRVLEALAAALRSIYVLDRFEHWMRENIGFEVQHGACEKVHQCLLRELKSANSLGDVGTAAANCRENAAAIRLNRPAYPLRVGVVGELYTLMEPYSNFGLERQLAKEGAIVSRDMSIWFLLFGRTDRRALREGCGYLQYTVGANGVDSISQSLRYAKEKYDGIVHMKSFGCIPELSATPALWRLCREEDIPVLQLSFDTHLSETGVQTRLEAFVDMLQMKKEAKRETAGVSRR